MPEAHRRRSVVFGLVAPLTATDRFVPCLSGSLLRQSNQLIAAMKMAEPERGTADAGVQTSLGATDVMETIRTQRRTAH